MSRQRQSQSFGRALVNGTPRSPFATYTGIKNVTSSCGTGATLARQFLNGMGGYQNESFKTKVDSLPDNALPRDGPWLSELRRIRPSRNCTIKPRRRHGNKRGLSRSAVDGTSRWILNRRKLGEVQRCLLNEL